MSAEEVIGKEPLYTEKDHFERWEMLLETYEIFKSSFERKTGLIIDLNPAILFQVVICYFYEMERYKDWHLSDPKKKKANDVKQFAFLVYWLVKLKPVYFSMVAGEYKKNDKRILANAMFAVLAGGLHQKKTPQDELLDELYYQLTYRETTRDSLLYIAMTLKTQTAGMRSLDHT